MLLLTAFIWGTAFVAQSVGAQYVGTYTYLAGRSWLAVIVLLPMVLLRDKKSRARGGLPVLPRTPSQRRSLVVAGLICGTTLCFASAAQQAGVATTTTAKAGFITALYVVIVPVMTLFVGKRPEKRIWGCILVAVVGLYLLCMKGGFELSSGDAVMLLCAFLFSIQIMCVDHFTPVVDGVALSWAQFLVVSVESTLLMFVFEAPTAESLGLAAFSIAYAGIFSSGVAYTLQIVGQEKVHPTVACLAMSQESEFSALSGWVILNQSMSPRELLGAGLMFAAIVLAQIPLPSRRKAAAD